MVEKVRVAEFPKEAWEREFLVDMVMTHAYSGESLKMSLSRLAKTAWDNKFFVLDPVAVIACYTCCRELRERPYDAAEETVWPMDRGLERYWNDKRNLENERRD